MKSLPTVTTFSDDQSHEKKDQHEAYGTLIAQAVDVMEIDVGWTRSKQLWRPLMARGVFGGQVVAQALMAACKTVESHFSLHSLHSYFILAGDNQIPILYQVERIRDGKTYATRVVKASQRGRVIFSASFSFAVAEPGISFEHQIPMPKVPSPESLPSEDERVEEVLKHPDLEIPEKYRTYLQQRLQEKAPIDYREVHVPTVQELARLTPIKSDRQQVWFKCHGTLNDDPVLHQAVLAYASDAYLLHTAVRTSGLQRTEIGMMASLDHTMWLHAPFRADEWLLYDMDSPRATNGRGLCFGRIYRQDGTLVASTAQEGIIRLSLRSQEKRRQKTKESKM